jgi:hypothetical protein
LACASLVCTTLACRHDGQRHNEDDELTRVYCDKGGCELPASAPSKVHLNSLLEVVKLGSGAGWERVEVLRITASGERSVLEWELDPKLRLDALEVLILHELEVDPMKIRELLARAPALEFLVCNACTGGIFLDFRDNPRLRGVSFDSEFLFGIDLQHTEHARRLELFSSTVRVNLNALAHASKLRVARLCVAEGADLTPLAASRIEELWLRPCQRSGLGQPTLPDGLAALQTVRALHLHGWGNATGLDLGPVLELAALRDFACRGCMLGSEPRLPDKLRYLDLVRSQMGSTAWAERLDRLVRLNLAGSYLESTAGLMSLDGHIVWLNVKQLWLPDDAELPRAYFVAGDPERHSELTRHGWSWGTEAPWLWGTHPVTFMFRSLGPKPPWL